MYAGYRAGVPLTITLMSSRRIPRPRWSRDPTHVSDPVTTVSGRGRPFRTIRSVGTGEGWGGAADIDIRPQQAWGGSLALLGLVGAIGLVMSYTRINFFLVPLFPPWFFVVWTAGWGLTTFSRVRQRCWSEGDVLHVRNGFSAASFQRSEIIGFGVADIGARGGRNRVVAVQTSAGRSLRIWVTARWYRRLFNFTQDPDLRNEADTFCDQLNGWLHATRPS